MYILTGGVPYDENDPRAPREGYAFREAVLLAYHPDTERFSTLCRYVSPEEVMGKGQSCLFNAGMIARNGKILVPTSTELVEVDPQAGWIAKQLLTLPFFHDMHAVQVRDGEMALVNTGTEEVVLLSYPELQIRNRYSLAPGRTREILAMGEDLRRLDSTKPHPVHVNYAFHYEGRWWATRFHQQDAIALGDKNGKIEIGVGNPHDGAVVGETVFFTTTNGHVVVAKGSGPRARVETFHVPSLEGGSGLIGWYRGILPLGNGRCWVAVSKLRPTRFKEYVKWVTGRDALMRSTLVKVNLTERRVEKVVSLPKEFGRMAIFSILEYPDEAGGASAQ